MNRFVVFLIVVVASLADSHDALSQTIDFERYPGNLAAIPDETLLTNQFLARGVRFPSGMIVSRCVPEPRAPYNECDQARSGQNVAISQLAAEFNRHPVMIEFTSRQRLVSLYVNGYYQGGHSFTATLRAYDAAGVEVASDARTFASGVSWTAQLRVQVATPTITRVVVSGGDGQEVDLNALLVDDVTFEGEAPPPVTDSVAPVVAVTAPVSGASLAASPVAITIRATDNLQLQTVDMELRNASTGAMVLPFTGGAVCGGPFTSPCAPTVVDHTASFPLGTSGQYQVTLRSTDAAGNNAIERRSTFILGLSPLPQPPRVVAHSIEFNQGIQRALEDAHTTFGTDAHIGIPVIPGKDLVLRYYLFAQGGTRNNYRARLYLDIEKVDGSHLFRNFYPNDGSPSTGIRIDATPSATEINAALIGMRANLSSTLNFVIPGTLLFDASFMELRLREGFQDLSWAQVSNIDYYKASLGLDIIRVAGMGFGGPVANAAITNALQPYFTRTYPVSKVYMLSSRRYSANRPATGNDCSFLLQSVNTTFLGDTLPSATGIAEPLFRRYVAIAASLNACAGVAYLGPVTLPGVAVSLAAGDTAAHEVGHTMGLVHASNSHGEAAGGAWEPWPFPHGTIGQGADNFGTILQQQVSPGPDDAGQWTVTLIDPCSAATVAARFPTCSLGEGQAPHDFMSYGSSNTFLGTLVTRGRRWISNINYERLEPRGLWGRASSAGAADAQTGDSEAERIEALMISGTLNSGGTISLLPLMRKPLPRVALNMSLRGPYTLELYDTRDNLVLKRSFDARRLADTDQRHISLAVPYNPKARSLLIRRESVVLLQEKASENAPKVRVVGPNGGEVWEKGTHTISWVGEDADGDKLSYLVQYSPDRGHSWQGIALVHPGEDARAELFVDELIPGKAGIVRVTASDGFNTTSDQSDDVFTLGTPGGESPAGAGTK